MTWRILLGTDAQSQHVGMGIFELTNRGVLQVGGVVQDVHYQVASTVPPVIVGSRRFTYRATAEELCARLGPESRLIDWSMEGFYAYQANAADGVPLARLLSREAPEALAVVLVTSFRHAECILEAAGVPVNTSLRNMRATRVYPVQLDADGTFSPADYVMLPWHAGDLVGTKVWPADVPWD